MGQNCIMALMLNKEQKGEGYSIKKNIKKCI